MLTESVDRTAARNQSVALEDYDTFAADRPLAEALEREGADWARERAHALGAISGSADVLQAGREANANKPVFRPFDRYGHRIDEVDYHPAYHRLDGARRRARAARAALARRTRRRPRRARRAVHDPVAAPRPATAARSR